MHAPNTGHCFDAVSATDFTDVRDFLAMRDFLEDKDENENDIVITRGRGSDSN